MCRGVIVGGGVAPRRVVAATDMSAGETDPEMKPFTSLAEADLAAIYGERQLADPDLVEVSAPASYVAQRATFARAAAIWSGLHLLQP